jgi:hypothetical protein
MTSGGEGIVKLRGEIAPLARTGRLSCRRPRCFAVLYGVVQL